MAKNANGWSYQHKKQLNKTMLVMCQDIKNINNGLIKFKFKLLVDKKSTKGSVAILIELL